MYNPSYILLAHHSFLATTTPEDADSLLIVPHLDAKASQITGARVSFIVTI